jgi:hypothetical protein
VARKSEKNFIPKKNKINNLTKLLTGKMDRVCWFYNNGNCNNEGCVFRHIVVPGLKKPAALQKPCRNEIRYGRCSSTRCTFLHSVACGPVRLADYRPSENTQYLFNGVQPAQNGAYPPPVMSSVSSHPTWATVVARPPPRPPVVVAPPRDDLVVKLDTKLTSKINVLEQRVEKLEHAQVTLLNSITRNAFNMFFETRN